LEKLRLQVLADAAVATKVDRVTFQGTVMSTFDDVDHATRLAAAKDIARLNGTEPAKSAPDKGSGPIIYVVNAPQVFVPKPRRHVEVIDVTPLPST